MKKSVRNVRCLFSRKALVSVSLMSILMLNSFTTVSTKAIISNEDIQYKDIVRYNTNEKILLHGNSGDVVKVPTNDVKQKRQFRSAWVSTVFNIDFNQTNGSIDKFKKEFTKVLNELESLNMNAVTFQVRPSNDAFYPSKLNPWSRYLTGAEGKAPEKNFDPLKYMVEETHKRNMEFHAWFNPYRVTTSAATNSTSSLLSKLDKNNWARKNPKYVINYKGKLLLNPGEPAVRSFIINTVMEVVKNYDIDAVHFDDYFYPYGTDFGQKGEDLQTFKKYKGDFKDIKEWRRNNVNVLIETLNDTIKREKDYVKFGISPFGIWGGKSKHEDGSNTSASTLMSYDAIYADTKRWVQEGWIDYITPQIYWSFASKEAPYGELVDWWANVVKGNDCSLYIGHALYKYTEGSSGSDAIGWKNPEEIFDQLRFNSLYSEVKGSTFFSLKEFRKNAFKSTDKFKNSFFSKQALIPTMPWLDNKAPETIKSLKVETKSDITLNISDSKDNDSYYYIIYRFDEGQEINIDNPNAIIAKIKRQGNSEKTIYKDMSADLNKKYDYVVTAVDRLHNEAEGVSVK